MSCISKIHVTNGLEKYKITLIDSQKLSLSSSSYHTVSNVHLISTKLKCNSLSPSLSSLLQLHQLLQISKLSIPSHRPSWSDTIPFICCSFQLSASLDLFHLSQLTHSWNSPLTYTDYNCKAFFYRDRSQLGSESDLNNNNFFYISSWLCDLGQLNFYKKSDNTWKFYKNGGNGDLQGTCYSNTGMKACGATTGHAENRLVYHSYICNP